MLVLGAGSGIAMAITRILFERWKGASFYLLARNTAALEQLAEDGRILGNEVLIYYHDLLLDAPLNFSNIEYCLVFAGWLPPDNNQEPKTMQVNFTGIKSFVDLLISQNSHSLKHIIVTGSIAGVRVRPSNKQYGAAKSALHQYIMGLQAKWKGKFNITLVIPGYVRTKMLSGINTPKILTVSAEEMAGKYFMWLKTKPGIVYSQPAWKLIGIILKLIPGFILRKMKF